MSSKIAPVAALCLAALCLAAPAAAQDRQADKQTGRQGKNEPQQGRTSGGPPVQVAPYIEASQLLVVQFSPEDDVVTYTQIAAGVDAAITGRNNGGSVSVRYERNIAYGGTAAGSDTLSGVARGYATIIPLALTVEAGALAARSTLNGNGAASLTPIGAAIGALDNSSQIYSVFAGPNLHAAAGDVELNANYRIGYTRVETDNALITPNGVRPIDIFDESTVQVANFHAATRPGQPLPVGLGIGGGWMQEDISNFDQRVRDAHVRADITVSVRRSLVVVAGIGYEDVEVSSRDALLDADGFPVTGPDGRIVTDASAPRQIAYDVSGLIWDVGVVWRPSRRTTLEATVGRRYDSATYHGSFDWAPTRRSRLGVSVYDAVAGFGGQLNNALANLPTRFSATRNSLTGDLGGCVASSEGNACLSGALGSIRSATFRSRGIAANYSASLGRMNAGVGAGYDRRKFIAAPGTALAAANGVIDENYWVTFYLDGELGSSAGYSANTYANWLRSGFNNTGDVFAIGASAAYRRSLTGRLSARAAVAIDHIDTAVSVDDITAASALLGLRYDF